MKLVNLKPSQLDALKEIFDLNEVTEIRFIEKANALPFARERWGSSVCIEIYGKNWKDEKEPIN